MEVKNGTKVKVHYTGTIDDGKVFDSSEGKEPLEFVVGSGQIIKGFEEGIVGMKEGEEKEIKIPSDKAYGQRNEQMIQQVPRDSWNADSEPKEGMQLMLKSPDGKQMLATIAKVEDDTLTIDMNHPLAGKDLTFKVKVESVEEGKPEEQNTEPQE